MKSKYLLAVLIAASLPASGLLAQGEKEEEDKPKGDHPRMEEMHQKMEEQGAEMDKLVAAMNSATGEKKVDAMAAVINKMIEQRKAMMQGRMMGERPHRNAMEGPKAKPESSTSPAAH